MGQLEKYGLYVLCLVIFLILGVTIWGQPDVPLVKPQPSVAMHTSNSASTATPPRGPGGTSRSLDDVFGPSERDARATDASGSRTGGRPGGSVGEQPKPNDPPKVDPKPGDPKLGDPAVAQRVAYKVQDGDTYESLARTKLGKASLWTEIQNLNPGIKPEKLRAGQEIFLPTAAALATKDAARAAATSKPVPAFADAGRTYTVKKGDNFERIAFAELGSKKRTEELMGLNPGIKPEKLKPDMVLKLPKK